ncbi:hypothetical protein IW148_006016 [Coemansia sp. RSA 1199]|nr:hypothetical protein IW148_006016 [Coemansia sp. RSA 1199]
MNSVSKGDSEQAPALEPVPATNGKLAVNDELVADPVAVNGELQPAFTVDPTTASETEQRGCREFFLGKANKTAERYMRIRNHMIAEWETTKPTYLTKIRARAGLKNCGDVNAIGRVHTFLENARIINAGAVQARRRPAVRSGARRVEYSSSDASSDEDEHVGMGATGRRRRVRGKDGAWVNEDEYYGGRVISHDVVERHADDAGTRRHADDPDYSDSGASSDGTRRKRRRQRVNGRVASSEFRLIPCRAFGAGEAPFAVRIAAGALVLMDLHAHLMYTEIIGLLGGQFNTATRAVDVEIAFPCNSTSTTTECEMDPASEVEARRVFSATQRHVVGWFHSHPTFEATPSVRDIHNQHAYQTLCRRADGIEPFIGAIVSPPGSSGAHGVSDISVFYVPQGTPGADDNEPFSLAYDVTGRDAVPTGLVDTMVQLIETHAGMVHRANLAKSFRRNDAAPALEKLVASMRSHWADAARPLWDDAVATRLRPLLLRYFCRGSGSETGCSTPVTHA